MERLNEILHELGISKVKLAKFLGVSRQMIYNYLDLDDINKWPKDKKVMLLNLLGIKSPDELSSIKVDTDYIMSVEARISSIFEANQVVDYSDNNNLYNGLGKKQKEVMHNIIDIMKEKLEDDKDQEALEIFKYLYHCLQALDSVKEIKYMLAYISKSIASSNALEYAFNEDDQFIFESILFSGMTLYHSGGASKSKLVESHKRFVNQIEHRKEEKLSRTLELNLAKVQALKELGYTTVSDTNVSEVLEKIAEIESRKLKN
jgi:hypothetical protein